MLSQVIELDSVDKPLTQIKCTFSVRLELLADNAAGPPLKGAIAMVVERIAVVVLLGRLLLERGCQFEYYLTINTVFLDIGLEPIKVVHLGPLELLVL